MNERANKNIDFSIIIPVQKINDYILETCEKLKKLDNRNFEIIIFTDEIGNDNKSVEEKLGAKIIPSGKVSPAIKRDMASKQAKGKLLAFIDDDAYPDEKWLDIAMKYIDNENIAAIGGPQLTPSDDSFWQKVSGAVFLSPLSGSALIRYWPGKKVEEVVDWPTVNFIVKKEIFDELGGFDSQYWPGEDTKLCLDIIKKTDKKILYAPELKVYHHRRSGLKRHLKQIGNYGLHRGFFAKAFPETSKNIFYFLPSIFILLIIIGALSSLYSAFILRIFLLGIALYFIALIYSTAFIYRKTNNFFVSLATIPYLILTHIWYGIRFIQGYIFTKELKSKLR